MRNLKRIVVSGVAALMVPLVPANAVDGPPPENLKCGAVFDRPHFSRGSLLNNGEWQIHGHAKNWCSATPNELALGGRIFRSSWRGWIEEPHIGKSKNPTVGTNKTNKKGANKFVIVAECEPETWYKWKARYGNSATVNGKPVVVLDPVYEVQTSDEIRCGAS